jgi:SecD/SecF fusion protein
VKIDATIADDISRSSKLVSIFAIIGIFIFVWIRYPNWAFAAGAIAALIHDLFFTLGILSICKGILPFHMEINQTVIAAILTILGYSTNDTMVIFDRIREYLKLKPTVALEENVNSAVNKTLARTLMTSSTLLLVTLVLFFLGGESLKSFSFTMVIGLLVGTYSSIFVASPIAVDIMNWSKKKADPK